MSALRDAALDYARRGFPVFPLAPRSKVPRAGSHGFQDATTDLDKIEVWWHEHPDANIGIATGHGGVFAVDVDPGKGGSQSIEKLRPADGWPRSLFSKTGGGGIHFFFRSATAVKSSQGFRKGVDIRGAGGYVVAPPSVHPSGGVYEWATTDDIADAPESLVEAIVAKHREKKLSGRVEEGETIKEGLRNDTAISFAGSMRRLGFDEESIFAALRADPRFDPPLSDGELRSVSRSSMRWPAGTTPDPPDYLFDAPDPAEPFTVYESPSDYSHLLPAGKTVVDAPEREPGSDDDDDDDDAADPAPVAPTTRDHCRAMRKRAKEPRVATGFPTIDRATAGGFRSGGIILGGAPGAGKTSLMCQIALRWARLGHQVVMLLADESPDGILCRMGMQLGFNRQKLESGDDDEHDRFEAAICAIETLTLVDYDLQPVAVWEAATKLLERAGGKRCLLCADSVQTIGEGDGELMDRVDRIVKALRTAAHAGVTVMATSELVKASYANRKTAADFDPMSAFKGSSSIPHLGEVLLVMRSVTDSNDLFDVEVPKNRMGPERRFTFRLLLHADRAEFDEVPVTPDAHDAPDPSSVLYADRTRVKTVITNNPGVRGYAHLRQLVRAGQKRGKGMSNDRIDIAVDELMERGEIINAPKDSRPRWYVAPAGDDEPQF